jgi:hypothetical protein
VEDGALGPTPSITALVTVDSNIGTPSCTVTKTGTDEDPILTFAFSCLKGQKGDTGSGSSVAWGEIYDDISLQTDLVAALNAKKDVADSDTWTSTVTQANGVAVFDNLNPDYGYEICYVSSDNATSVSIPKWTNLKQEDGTSSGTIKLTWTIKGGTDGTSQFRLRILK